MRIQALERRAAGDRVRVSARVCWEDSPREPLELAFDAEGPAAESLAADPNALLLAAALPAMRHRERRIAIEGAVCPRLADGLRAAAAILRSWYGPPRTLPAIEPAKGFHPPVPAPPRAGAFLSGGLDSLDVFLRNRACFPPGHPARVEDALHVSGLPFTGPAGSPSHEGFVCRARTAATEIARRIGVPLSFVTTNLGEIDRDFLFFRSEYFGSAYAAVAQLFSSRFTEVSYASAQQAGIRLDPLGSHPLLDPLYSTSALVFRHTGADRTRLEKAREAASRPDLLPHVHVCLRVPFEGPGANCGRCEKCQHTQIELLLAGAPRPAFPADSLTVDSIRALRPDPHTRFFWAPFAEPLRLAGRGDLADAADELVGRMDEVHRWMRDAGWKGRLRRLDRRLFAGRLLRARRFLLGRSASA